MFVKKLCFLHKLRELKAHLQTLCFLNIIKNLKWLKMILKRFRIMSKPCPMVLIVYTITFRYRFGCYEKSMQYYFLELVARVSFPENSEILRIGLEVHDLVMRF